MKTDFYISPAAETFQVKVEDVICGTTVERSLNYGHNNQAVSVDNDNYYNGGSF